MSALLEAPPVLGEPRPRLMSLPDIWSTDRADEAIDLSADAGLILDEWQRWCLTQSMGIGPDGLWSAFEVCWIVPRQNGKNAILRARELAGLFLLGEELIIHTAHEFKASREHFRKMINLVKGTPSLHKRVKPNGYRTSHGEEAIELRPTPTLIFGAGGKLVKRSVEPRLLFLARSRGSGRSFTCDCLVYDEAMILTDEEVGASLPTLSAIPNPQVWYTASAGLKDSTQLSQVRNRGIAGDNDLAFGEWSVDPHNDYCAPNCTLHDNRDDPRSWARANPGLGIRLSLRHTQREHDKMPAAKFDRERLGVGDWPVGNEAWLVIPEQVWAACQVGEDIERARRICVAADVTPDQSAATIAIGQVTTHDGQERLVAEIGQDPQGWVDHRAGVQWVVPRLKELKLRNRIGAIVIDPISPANVLIPDCEKAGLEILKPTTRDVGQAHMQFCSWARDIPADGDKPAQPRKLAHLGQVDLRSAVAAGVTRDLGDGQKTWARRSTAVDISPVCAATLAVWAANKFGRGYDILKSIA